MLTAVVAGTVAGLGSVPHCAGMCGPLAAFACGRTERRPGGAPWRYQLGRLAGYATLGGVAGGFGGAVASQLNAPWARAAVSWTLAAALLWTAWRFWRLADPPRGCGAATVSPETLRRGRRSPAGGIFPRLAAVLPRDPAVFGALTALLPCGALYAALAIAAGTGSAGAGAAAMAAFSAASGIGVFGAGAVAERLRSVRRPEALRVLAVTLALGGLVLVIRPVHALDGEPVLCHEPGAESP